MIIKPNEISELIKDQIKNYSHKIETSDVVKCNFLYKGIVSFIDYDENGEEIFEVIVGNGELKTFSRDELTRTGKNVDILNTISKLAFYISNKKDIPVNKAVISVSMQTRTESRPEYSALSEMNHDLPWCSTSDSTINLLNGMLSLSSG